MSKFAVELIDINKTYSSKKVALNNINMKIPKESFFALLGANGAGKSTLIGIITGIVKQQTGTVKILDKDTQTHARIARVGMGVVPQEVNMSPFESVKQILINQAGFYGLMPSQVSDRADKLLKQLDLWEKRDSKIMALSGGMKRRVMIARALIHDPYILLLDEPSAGLDIAIRHHVWGYLRKLNKAGLTILLTTHYLEEAESLCNHVALIRSGELVKQDKMSSLIKELDRQLVDLTIESSISKLPELNLEGLKLLPDGKIQVEISKNISLGDVISLLNEKKIKVLKVEEKVSKLEYYFLQNLEGLNIKEGLNVNE